MECNMPFLAFNRMNEAKDLCIDDEEISSKDIKTLKVF